METLNLASSTILNEIHYEIKINGMAAGVMLAASFDLIQEGQDYDFGSWVVTGILAGGIFIWLCKKVTMILPILWLSFFLLIVITRC
jgi:hypothetical protein